jgi:hypothetical protein
VEDKMATTKEVIEKFNKMTMPQLKSYAKKNKIDLVGANTKLEILEAILPFVPRQDNEEKKIKNESLKEKIAVYSERNIHWNGVGDLEKGYNIVTKEASVKWLTHKSVRQATPEEVAKHYGKI